MSPFIAPIFLGLLLWALVSVVGLIARKPRVAVAGLPAVLILAIWVVASGIAPNPKEEFDRIFGAQNRPFVSEIRTYQPILREKHFMSFRVRPEDFKSNLGWRLSDGPKRPEFFEPLPRGWPASITAETHGDMWYLTIGETKAYIHYFPAEQMAYVAVHPPQW